MLPGGFSYGDYLRCGAIARFSPATAAVREFADAGGLVLGICNGFQILCEAGLLPGVLLRNESLRFVCRDVPLTRRARRPARSPTRCAPGQAARDPGEARRRPLVRAAAAARRSRGEPAGRAPLRRSPNGSVDDIAGVCNERGNVMGLMPHPEHAVDPLLGSDDGALMLASLVEAARERRWRSPERDRYR